MKRPRTRWPILATAAVLVLVLAAPATAADGPWQRAPRTGQADVSARGDKPLPAFAPAERDALTRALERGRIDPATYALERARALFDLGAVRSRYGDVRRADPREATLILRDLVLRLDELSATQLRQARAILARPTDGATDPEGDGYTTAESTPFCFAKGCIHYVNTTDDAPDLIDTSPANGVPDYVDAARATLKQVWRKEITTYRYRAPKSDIDSVNNGGDSRIDVYLADVGADGLYGYCTTDDPNAVPGSVYLYLDFSAYCVVDEDFAPGQFPGVSGTQALQVTMAHEFFHAVQFAYDAAEDAWFMESTSTWMEDEVYDGINDNRQYLAVSPITVPGVPLDSNNEFNVYGDWIFHKFLVESSGDKNIILRAWRNADGSQKGFADGNEQYGLEAIATEVEDAGAKFRWAFADFGMWNDFPRALYSEAEAYPLALYSAEHKLTRANGRVGGSQVLDHLTNSYVGFIPGRGVRSEARLRIAMDGPPYKTGPEASVVVFKLNGRILYKPLVVDKRGDVGALVPFGKGKVAAVDLVMTNASMRRVNGECWVDENWDYSCAGYPRDDDRLYAYEARLIQ